MISESLTTTQCAVRAALTDTWEQSHMIALRAGANPRTIKATLAALLSKGLVSRRCERGMIQWRSVK